MAHSRNDAGTIRSSRATIVWRPARSRSRSRSWDVFSNEVKDANDMSFTELFCRQKVEKADIVSNKSRVGLSYINRSSSSTSRPKDQKDWLVDTRT